MRKLLIAAAVLVVVGLALFLFSGSDESGATAKGSEQATAARPVKATAGTKLQPESREDVGVRGSADSGSTPALALSPTEEDGVLEVEVLAGERPVPGASVRLYWRGARDPNLGEVSWRLASSSTTDARGRASLASRPGGYLVAVRAQGYAPLLRDVVRPYGEARTHLRLALEAGLSLTGRTVVRGTNEPLPLVALVLTAHGRSLEGWQSAEAPAEERMYATSDERGNFRVEGLAPGGYQLEARALGHARAVLRNVKVPETEPLTVALQVAGVIEGFVVDAQGRPAEGAEVQVSGRTPQVVTTGQGGGFSAEVESGAYTVSARRGDEAGSLEAPVTVSAGKTVRDVRVKLGQGAGLEGRVVARATGAPVVGANVDVSPAGANGDSGRAVTDDSGRFSVGGLAPGSYDVAVSAPGFASLTRRGLTVASGERFPVELQLLGTGSVEGLVRDSSGQPIPGVRVVGGNRWGGQLGTTPAETLTNTEGHYRLEGLATGRLYLTARREGSTLGVSQSAGVTEGGTARVDFTLEEPGTIEGVVRADSGSLPTGSLMVRAFPQGQNRFGPPDIGRTEADAAGNFRMVLPPGAYGLHAFLPERGGGFFASPTPVQVEAGKTVHTELTWQNKPSDANAIQGLVLEPDGTPSSGAFVTLATEDSSRGARMIAPTDEEGRFVMSLRATDESSGRLTVSARNGGRSGEVQRVKRGEREVVVKLRPAAGVRGRVVLANGSPVKGFTIGIMLQGQAPFPQGRTTWEFPGDRFELRDVPAEPVRLVVRTTDGAGGEARVTPSLGTMAEVEVSVRATAGVRGRVVDATTKAPMAEALVLIEGERSSTPNEGTAADGRFTMEGVTPGERTLVIMAGGSFRMPERRQLTLVEGQVLDLGDVPLSSPRAPPGTIGAQVGQEGPRLVISHVIPEGPSARAGLQKGDVLLAVDGAPVATPQEAFQRLRGAPGSTVVLKVRRAGAEQSISVTRAT